MTKTKNIRPKNYPYDKIYDYLVWFNRTGSLFKEPDWHVYITFEDDQIQIKSNAIFKLYYNNMSFDEAIGYATKYGFKINKAGIVYDVDPEHIINATELGLL